MKKARYLFLLTALSFAAVVSANTGEADSIGFGPRVSHRSNSATGQKSDKAIESVSSNDAYQVLKKLNDARELFPLSLTFFIDSYKGLAPANCLGVTFPNNLILVGESSGQDYGLGGEAISSTGERRRKVLVGFLHAQFPFSLEGKPMPKGSFVVWAYEDRLEVEGDGSESYYNVQARRQLPRGKSEEFLFKSKLPAALLAEKSNQRPRFSMEPLHDSVLIHLEGNTFVFRQQ